MQVTFTLKRKSGNKGLPHNEMISSNDRMHHAPKAKITAHLRVLGSKIDTNNEYYTPENPCTVLVNVYAPSNRRMDPPNWYPTVKALLDGFTDAGLWSDDDYSVIKYTTFGFGGKSKEKGKYDLEIIVKPYKEYRM